MKNTNTLQVPPLMDNGYLISRIAVVTNSTEESVRQRLIREHREIPFAVAEEFYKRGLTPYVFNDDMIRFYEETDSFIYEIVVWNRTAIKGDIREWIKNKLADKGMEKGKILICGDGLGFDSLYFARQGYDVTFFEVSKPGIEFASRMFADYGASVTICQDFVSLPKEGFDAVLCLDVLEHVPEPLQTAKEYASLLRPGGFFIFSAPFYLVHRQWPTHLDGNRKYSGRIGVFERACEMKLVESRFLQNPVFFQKNGGVSCRRMSFGRRLLVWYGSVWLRIFGVWPQPLIFIIRRLFRQNPVFEDYDKKAD